MTLPHPAHPAFVAMEGWRFGRWTVVSYEGGGWSCRCDCGTVKIHRGTALRAGQSQGCKGCYDQRQRVPDAERVCRWCGRSTIALKGTSLPRECHACNRRACRNGREADGRPVYRIPRA